MEALEGKASRAGDPRNPASPGARRGLALVAALCVALAPPAPAAGPALSVRHGKAWVEWWRADRAPGRWTAPDPRLTGALAWRPLGRGVSWAKVQLAGSLPAWRTELIVVRVDPRRVRLSLEMALAPEDGRPAWTIDRAPAASLVAVNAGQFLVSMPWGWLVMDGHQRLAPGTGPLSAAFAVDRAGSIHWIPGDSLARPPSGMAIAFQSYPTLLERDGRIPLALRTPGRGVDLVHRDARLALGEARDGALLIVMTRFAAFGRAAEQVPIGPTTPEMAAILGALGARDAVMLDGGISAQMALREAGSGRIRRWPGWRKVPLALIVRPREP